MLNTLWISYHIIVAFTGSTFATANDLIIFNGNKLIISRLETTYLAGQQ
jgi:hypothetical protein